MTEYHARQYRAPHEIREFGSATNLGYEGVQKPGEIPYMTQLELISCIARLQHAHLEYLEDHHMEEGEAISPDIKLDGSIAIGVRFDLNDGEDHADERELEIKLVDYRVVGVHSDGSVPGMLIIDIAKD